MAQERFCKDCKWVRVSWFMWLISGYALAKCGEPTQLEVDGAYLVTGKSKTPKPDRYCSVERRCESSDMCGAEGRLYEPRTEG